MPILERAKRVPRYMIQKNSSLQQIQSERERERKGADALFFAFYVGSNIEESLAYSHPFAMDSLDQLAT